MQKKCKFNNMKNIINYTDCFVASIPTQLQNSRHRKAPKIAVLPLKPLCDRTCSRNPLQCSVGYLLLIAILINAILQILRFPSREILISVHI